MQFWWRLSRHWWSFSITFFTSLRISFLFTVSFLILNVKTFLMSQLKISCCFASQHALKTELNCLSVSCLSAYKLKFVNDLEHQSAMSAHVKLKCIRATHEINKVIWFWARCIIWLWINISVFSKIIFHLTILKWNYLHILKVIFMKDLRFISSVILIICINKKQHLKHSDKLNIKFKSSWLQWKFFHSFNTLTSVKNITSI